MVISVASGKGGTGKTTLATGLAAVLGERGQLLDCDVEEPNAHLFLKPDIQTSRRVTVPIPKVDEDRCTLCGKCQEVCQFNAIVVLGKTVLPFEHMCHGCGGCMRLCPEGCIQEGEREIGVVQTGRAGPIEWVQGKLRIGEAMAPPLIRAVKQEIDPHRVAVIDAPPGTSCPVIASVLDTDYTILVTEPTPFGFHDLVLAVEAIRTLGIPMGVVLNRSDMGGDQTREYCRKEGIPILLEIPHDRKIAESYARGVLFTDARPEYRKALLHLLDRLSSEIPRA